MLRLPTGQYRLASKTLSVYQVLGEAMTAARTLGKKFAAVSTHGSSAWTGLEEVAADAKTAKKGRPIVGISESGPQAVSLSACRRIPRPPACSIAAASAHS